MYPIPHILSSRINRIFNDLDIDQSTKDELYNRIVDFYIRENRLIRASILRLAEELVEYAAQEEEDFGSRVSSYAGEETARYICDEFIRKRVYVNSEEVQMRQKQVDEIVGMLMKEDKTAEEE